MAVNIFGSINGMRYNSSKVDLFETVRKQAIIGGMTDDCK